ncbi:MAG: FAD-dependent oxidoreductase [Verrucomicrobia bacterium]|nr:FAD-dependent oxidoreductase [Verrucomicrobiota bacterium]
MSLIALTTLISAQEVAIVGGGIAGLTAAYRLQQEGVDAHVYEAKGRVGGRILTAHVDGRIGELGAQNISDGGDAENLLKLLDELNLEVSESFIHLHRKYVGSDRPIDQDELLKEIPQENLEERLESLAQNATNMRDVLLALTEEEGELYRFLNVRLACYEGDSAENLSPIYTTTLYHMLHGGLCSAHPGDETTICVRSVKNGNSTLTEKLAEALGPKVHLNTPLASLAKEPEGGYLLTFRNGETVRAGQVILAIPASVYNDISFGDAIPRETLDSIQNIRYGTNAKILVPAATPHRITFVNDWMIGFFTPKCDILTCYYTQNYSRFTPETIDQNSDRDFPMIERTLNVQLSKPEFALDHPFVSYLGPVGYSWPIDPYAKGSYSYIAPGQESILLSLEKQGQETVRTLFAPIDSSLFFAGEHTSILLDVPGTMEAACESGERAARMVIEARRTHRTPS